MDAITITVLIAAFSSTCLYSEHINDLNRKPSDILGGDKVSWSMVVHTHPKIPEEN